MNSARALASLLPRDSQQTLPETFSTILIRISEALSTIRTSKSSSPVSLAAGSKTRISVSMSKGIRALFIRCVNFFIDSSLLFTETTQATETTTPHTGSSIDLETMTQLRSLRLFSVKSTLKPASQHKPLPRQSPPHTAHRQLTTTVKQSKSSLLNKFQLTTSK